MVGKIIEFVRFALFIARSQRRAHLGRGKIGGHPNPEALLELVELRDDCRHVHFLQWSRGVVWSGGLVQQEVCYHVKQ